jgi:glutamine synthetase
MDAAGLLKQLESDGIENLWIVYHDYGGRACAKTVPQEQFTKAVERGVVFARANLNFTMEDHQAEGATYLAHTGDFLAVPDPGSYAVLPHLSATARVHAFMRKDDGESWEGCPRTGLRRMIDTCATKELSVRVGLEPEFILFKPCEDGEYQPADTDGMFTLAGLDRHYELWQEVIATLRGMGVQVEQFGKEYGPGQYEGSPHYGALPKAVDDYLTYKEIVRSLARKAGYVATFMPKPYAHLPGSGLHVHLSLWDTAGVRDLSIGESDEAPLSPLGRHFVAGLLSHAGALSGIGSPIVNSYKRLLPGSWAPAHICWGVGNRAALVRIPSMGERRHIEFRSGDNAANPFLFLTALLAAGLDGIVKEVELPPPVSEDVGHLSTEEAKDRGLELLPRSLPEALAALAADEVIADAIGPAIFREFLTVKRAELAAYDLHVHPWERQMYLEAI